MPRLFAATGDGVVRIDGAGTEWTATRVLDAAGAQCVAASPADADVAYAGLRDGGVRRTRDGGRIWDDCHLPEPGRAGCSVATTAVPPGMRWMRCSTCLRGPAGVSRRARGPRMSAGSRRA